MVIFSDAREIRSRFGPDIEQVQHVLRANHVDFGTPYDLPAVAQALENDPKLRKDLTDLSQSIMNREKNISLRTILNIIAIASGGPQIATTEEDMSQPVNTLDEFLVDVGASPANPQDPNSPSQESVADDRQNESHQALSLTSSRLDNETLMERSGNDSELTLSNPSMHQETPLPNHSLASS